MPIKCKFGNINFIGIGIRTPLAFIDFGNGLTLDMVWLNVADKICNKFS